MPKQKPEDMSDEMWTAVCIVMEDNQITSFKEMKDSHAAVMARMDEWENRIAEQAAKQQESAAAGQTDSDTAPQGSSGTAKQQGTGGAAPEPPPVKVEEIEEEKGSGKGGRKRWYERGGYAS